MAVAIGIAFLATPFVARAENAVCVGESCGGTYAAVTTTGQASSSSGVAVSGAGTANGATAAVSGGGDANGGTALSAIHNANGSTATSGTGNASGAAAFSGAGDANGSTIGISGVNAKVVSGGTTIVDGTGVGDSQVADVLETTTVAPVPDEASEMVAGGMELVTDRLGTTPPAPSNSESSTSSNNIPSCRNITYRGNAGAIYVQVGSDGYLQWGIYMYQSYENNGHWWVDVKVNGKRKDYKDQMYAPHGSLPPSVARRGSTFKILADLWSNSGRRYTNVPNECRIP